ncbi:MAG: hypothetical protein R3C69_13355 [Geminicoccaceae bacterium]
MPPGPEAAPVGADDVETLLDGGREGGEVALEPLGRQDGDHLDVARIDENPWPRTRRGEGLHGAREELGDGLAAAVEGDLIVRASSMPAAWAAIRTFRWSQPPTAEPPAIEIERGSALIWSMSCGSVSISLSAATAMMP